MQDQASELRKMAVALEDAKQNRKALHQRVIAITSGKGGVGKTNVVANLAMALTDYNKKVMVIDADLGLGNIDVLIGMLPKYNLQHVFSGQKTIYEIIMTGPKGIKIVPAASGVKELANLDASQIEKIIDKLNNLKNDADIMLIDTSAGISWNVLSFVLSSQEIIIVTTPDPTAITDAYAMIKVISKEMTGKNLSIKLIVNQVNNQDEAKEVANKITTVALRFLNTSIETIGYIYSDPNVIKAVKRQKPFLLEYPYSPAANCINMIAARLCNKAEEYVSIYEDESFFEKVIGFFMKPHVVQGAGCRVDGKDV